MKKRLPAEVMLGILLLLLGLLIVHKYEILLNKIRFREDIIASWWNCSKAGYPVKACGIVPTRIPEELRDLLEHN